MIAEADTMSPNKSKIAKLSTGVHVSPTNSGDDLPPGGERRKIPPARYALLSYHTQREAVLFITAV